MSSHSEAAASLPLAEAADVAPVADLSEDRLDDLLAFPVQGAAGGEHLGHGVVDRLLGAIGGQGGVSRDLGPVQGDDAADNPNPTSDQCPGMPSSHPLYSGRYHSGNSAGIDPARGRCFIAANAFGSGGFLGSSALAGTTQTVAPGSLLTSPRRRFRRLSRPGEVTGADHPSAPKPRFT